jgi:hypothetical protein
MKTKLSILFIAAACILLPSLGCATLGGSSSEPTVRLSNDGRIYVGQTYTGLTKLVSRLKADGIKSSERIIIEIPQNTSNNAISAISRELSSKGYRRFVFNKPLAATAQKGLDPLIKHLDKE